MAPDPKYIKKIGFMTKPELKQELENYSEEHGLKSGVICRMAIFDYLVKKGILKKEDRKKYI